MEHKEGLEGQNGRNKPRLQPRKRLLQCRQRKNKVYRMLHASLTAQSRIESIKISIYLQCLQTIYINKKIGNKIAPNIT